MYKVYDHLEGLGYSVKFMADDGSGGGGGGDGGDGEGKPNAADVFDFIDPTTGAKLPFPKVMKIADKQVDFQKLIGGVIGKTKKDVTQKLEETYKPILEKVAALEHKSDELTQLLQKAEDEKLSVEERTKKEQERVLQKAAEERDKALNQTKSLTQTLETVIADNDILSAMGEFPEIFNPGQLLQLIRLNYPIEVKLQQNGRTKGTVLIKLTDDDGKEELLPPKEAVSRLIAQEEFSHFLKSNLVAGGGSSSAVGAARKGSDGTLKYKRSALRDQKVFKEYSEKKMLGERVSIVED